MKISFKITLGLGVILFAVVLIDSVVVAQTGRGTFIDSRDGKTYRYVTIGNQTWMTDNLNFETSSGSWCYDNENSNCNTYGRLYDWATAMNISSGYNKTLWNGSDVDHRGVCPQGWHLPSNDEWQTLLDHVGGWESAGNKLKSETGWQPFSGISK